MKVKELIEALKLFPENSEVKFLDDYNIAQKLNRIESVGYYCAMYCGVDGAGTPKKIKNTDVLLGYYLDPDAPEEHEGTSKNCIVHTKF